MFPYLIGGAIALAALVLIANLRQKPTSGHASVSIDNDEFDGTVGDEDNTSTAANAGPRVALTALDDDNWEELLLRSESNLPMIVEFHTSWCPGCKAQAPIFQHAAAKYAAKARFFSADCDDFDHLARVGDVKKIPTTFFIEPSTKTQIVRVGLVQLDEVGEILRELEAKSAASSQNTDRSGEEHPYLLG
ncbi:MAG: thioredoxin family protein [Cyanobacteria bacterium REEB67]|nr:thioredoxin family protein [Cyanobacteria bacterium REEB67]